MSNIHITQYNIQCMQGSSVTCVDFVRVYSMLKVCISVLWFYKYYDIYSFSHVRGTVLYFTNSVNLHYYPNSSNSVYAYKSCNSTYSYIHFRLVYTCLGSSLAMMTSVRLRACLSRQVAGGERLMVIYTKNEHSST